MKKKLRRVSGRVRSRMGTVILLVLAMVGVAGLTTFIDLILAGRPVLAVAVPPATGVAAWFAWKIHAISLGVRNLRRRPVASPVPSALPAPREPEPVPVTERLRTINVFHPQPQKSEVPGRQSAAVSTDPNAPFNLFAATRGGELSAGRTFAVAGSDALVARLEQQGTVHRLHPSLSAAEMAYADPDVLVVEEDALAQGPWAGTLEPHGGKLLLELRVAMAGMRQRQRPIYVLATTGVPGLAAAGLRADTLVIGDDETRRAMEQDRPRSLATILAEHRAEEL